MIDRQGNIVTIHGMRCAANYRAWAIGTQVRNGFRVRRIVWGRALAREEKRDGERIRRAVIVVKPQ